MNKEKLKDFPITPFLDDICETLKNADCRSIVLTAETAAGKSTILPLALLDAFDGNIMMLEPRRLAVLNIANRVSDLLEEDVGNSCGYVMHMEHKTSKNTRFTVVTDAILTRKFQVDPLLEDVNVVVIDEFHERSVHGDLALAFIKEAMSLRDDLYVIIMSATMDTKDVSQYLGGAPVFSIPGRNHEVKIEYKPGYSVEKAVYEELISKDSYSDGSILVFLPGIREIRKAQESLLSYEDLCETFILHSSVDMATQRKVLCKSEPGSKRRVILSSAIAETSLTIPDVTVVIDSGLCRLNLFNARTGISSLVTRNVCLFDATQRAGRAGRVKQGKCVRLWRETEVLVKEKVPEILRCDLSSVVLECTAWGAVSYSSLNWLTKPSEKAWNSSIEYLELLGCIKNGLITDLGKSCLSLGVDLRIGITALCGVTFGKEELSTEFACNYIPDLENGSKALYLQGLELKRRVQICKENNNLSSCYPQEFAEFSTSFALCCGFADRIGILQKGTDEYKFYSGKIGRIEKSSGVFSKYIVATEIDGGDGVGRIFKFEKIEDSVAEKFLRIKSVSRVISSFTGSGNGKKVVKQEQICYGKVCISAKDLPVGEDDIAAAWINEIKEKGLECLNLSDSIRNFLIRVKFYGNYSKTNDSLDIKNKVNHLNETAEEWLKPFLVSNCKNGISDKQLMDALSWYLEKDKIDKDVPDMLLLENGKKRKVIYEEQNGDVIPVLEVIIQHIFGCFTTPKICGEKVLLRLLSPARRPLQITRDLENFWENSWPEICSEMKGRYPKHNWNYKVAEDD